MLIDSAQEDALLELLNTTPVVDGVPQDRLADPDTARAWQRAHGGTGDRAEREHLVLTRDTLQEVVRGRREAGALAPLLDGVISRPKVTDDGLEWDIDAPAEHRAGVRAVLAWSALHRDRPGRLRPCANPDCRLFLLDRSKPNQARWCSMAVCGNRMKARRHYQRVREATGN